ncbi:DUF937 domain-containing protein [Oleomonas cavernae]|uniref:DUF937 domain-containing protein n=1 Tax=Oleomonas cavernae TaxID=2320859 RepID=A0A418WEF5_9PROT|nr:YidB family protein [Oleomonas cavernae]RJF88408.1 DUF937 domain-containing protein [Oleomonas cavernae]
MDIIQLGIKLLQEHFGSQVNADAIGGALGKLLGGGDGKLDLAGLVSRFSGNGGLQGLVGSWLGDGPNQGIDASQILSIFGGDKVGSFAQEVGVSTDAAAGGLAAAIPQMIDKFSSSGNLLESTGGLAGVLDVAKKLF